jgi:hypothetical protein
VKIEIFIKTEKIRRRSVFFYLSNSKIFLSFRIIKIVAPDFSKRRS